MTRLTFFLALLLLAATCHGQSVSIASVPSYGSPGNLTGWVSGIPNPQAYRVAVYIHIEGSGWWNKPGGGVSAVPVASNGFFSANVVTGGIDDRATGFYVALVPPGGSAPSAMGANNIPTSLTSVAEDFEERYAREIQFAGRTWGVKDAPIPVGPGGNFFSAGSQDVFVDGAGRLHLRVRFSNGAWRASEVILKESLGYGTYWFTTESEVEDLDHQITFGAFTWDVFGDDFSIPTWPNREIDFEDSRWGNPSDPTTSQVVVQPYQTPGNLIRFTLPDLSADPVLTRFFSWQPNVIQFWAEPGRYTPCTVPLGPITHRSSYLHNPSQGRFIPPAGRERFRFNLWINSNAGAPANGQTAEVIISNFRFSPWERVFEGGSGVNRPGGLSVVSGTPAVGTTITLGIDDQTGLVTPGASTLLLLSAFPSAQFPAGEIFSGLGFLGQDFEYQLALSPDPLILTGTTWTGPGSPVTFPINIPLIFQLLGVPLYAQGILYNPSPAIAMTDALELCIGL